MPRPRPTSARRPPRHVLSTLAATLLAAAVVVLPSAPAAAEDYSLEPSAESCAALRSALGAGPGGNTFSWTCTIRAGATRPGDRLTVATTAQLVVDDFVNDGTIETFKGPETNNLRGTFDVMGSGLTNRGTTVLRTLTQLFGAVHNSGTLESREHLVVHNAFTNAGTLAVSGWQFSVEGPIRNDGTLTVACTTQVDVDHDGAITGTAPVFACGPTDIALAEATTSVGDPAGTVVGDLTTPGAPDRGPYTFTVVEGDGFTVTGTQLTTTSALTGGEHLVTVRVRDRFGHYLDERFTVTISRRTQDVRFTTSPTEPVKGGRYLPGTTSTGGSAPIVLTTTTQVCTLDGGSVRFDHAGLCAITATQAGDATYEAGSAMQSFEVDKAPQAVAFTSSAPTGAAALAGSTYAATAASTAGLPVDLTSATPSVCAPGAAGTRLLAAGTCTLLADQPGDRDHHPAAQVVQAFAVAKAPQTVAITSVPDQPRKGDTYRPTATGGGSGQPVVLGTSTPAVCSVDAGEVTFDHAGLCTVTATQAGDAAHDPGSVSQDVAVGKAAHVVSPTSTVPTGRAALVGQVYAVTAASDAGLPVRVGTATPEVCRLGDSPGGRVVELVAAGTCTVTVDAAGDADHVDAPTARQTFTVHAVGAPRIVATPSSRSGVDTTGWSRTPVTVTFTCTPSPGATLIGGCPSATVWSRQVRSRVVSGTVRDSAGLTSVARVTLRIDRTDPVVEARGVQPGATYDRVRRVRCVGSDAFSGLASCMARTERVRLPGGDLSVRYRVRATDLAGNTASRRGRYTVS